jgi:phytoene/squalene synthetase
MNALQQKYIEIYNSIDFEHINDHPNILIAARFWDEKRYNAAKTFYKFMRSIDDFIDNHKAINKFIAENEKERFTSEVDSWLKMIIEGDSNKPAQKEITDTIKKFRIPSWPLEAFAKSMIYDINNEGFPTLKSFFEYAGGASVAPAAIFVHLAGLRELENKYSAPAFNVSEAATSCAIFSYLVHIIRDFQKDQLNGLNYFAEDLIEQCGLKKEELIIIAKGGHIPDGFRDLIKIYYDLAEEYRQKTYDCIRAIWPYLEARYQLSLEIIFELYLLVFERIDIKNGKFTTKELNPTTEESKARVYQTIINSRTLKLPSQAE